MRYFVTRRDFLIRRDFLYRVMKYFVPRWFFSTEKNYFVRWRYFYRGPGFCSREIVEDEILGAKERLSAPKSMFENRCSCILCRWEILCNEDWDLINRVFVLERFCIKQTFFVNETYYARGGLRCTIFQRAAPFFLTSRHLLFKAILLVGKRIILFQKHTNFFQNATGFHKTQQLFPKRMNLFQNTTTCFKTLWLSSKHNIFSQNKETRRAFFKT